MRRRLLFVGMAPSSSSNPKKPLDCASGRTLARYFGHVHVRDFADAVNLLERYPGKSRRSKGDRFPMKAAHANALRVAKLFHRYRYVVVLGDGPRRAFDLEWFRWTQVFGSRLVAIPHPSGVNHWYNDPKNRARLSKLARRVLV